MNGVRGIMELVKGGAQASLCRRKMPAEVGVIAPNKLGLLTTAFCQHMKPSNLCEQAAHDGPTTLL